MSRPHLDRLLRTNRLHLDRLRLSRFRIGRRLTPATLRGRLALLALATTALWVALLTLAFNVALGAILDQQADNLLRTRAAAVSDTVQVRDDGRLVVRQDLPR